MKKAVAVAEAQGNKNLSHFGPDANEFDKIEKTFKDYGTTGQCDRRYYTINGVIPSLLKMCSNARFTKVVPAPDEPVTTTTGFFFDICFSV
jgi:phosphoribulokinase